MGGKGTGDGLLAGTLVAALASAPVFAEPSPNPSAPACAEIEDDADAARAAIISATFAPRLLFISAIRWLGSRLLRPNDHAELLMALRPLEEGGARHGLVQSSIGDGPPWCHPSG